MKRADGGYFVRGQAVIRGHVDREELVCVFAADFFTGDPLLAYDIANQLNREADRPAIRVPAERRRSAPPTRVVTFRGCIFRIREDGEIANPVSVPRHVRLAWTRRTAVPA